MEKFTFKGLVIVTVSIVVIGADILTVAGVNLRLKFLISNLLSQTNEIIIIIIKEINYRRIVKIKLNSTNTIKT